jgi:hypothetical protein
MTSTTLPTMAIVWEGNADVCACIATPVYVEGVFFLLYFFSHCQ